MDTDLLNSRLARRQRGITLLEGMLVASIIGLLASIALPSYLESIDRKRLEGASEAVLSDLRWARSEAIKRNVPVRMSFVTEPGAWGYTVVPDTGRTGLFNEPAILSVGSDEWTTVQMTGVEFGSGEVSTEFDPVRGTATAGTISLMSSRGIRATITLSPLGRSRICGFGRYKACE
jgi:Tfp pilus assembly protein FimT